MLLRRRLEASLLSKTASGGWREVWSLISLLRCLSGSPSGESENIPHEDAYKWWLDYPVLFQLNYSSQIVRSMGFLGLVVEPNAYYCYSGKTHLE